MGFEDSYIYTLIKKELKEVTKLIPGSYSNRLPSLIIFIYFHSGSILKRLNENVSLPTEAIEFWMEHIESKLTLMNDLDLSVPSEMIIQYINEIFYIECVLQNGKPHMFLHALSDIMRYDCTPYKKVDSSEGSTEAPKKSGFHK